MLIAIIHYEVHLKSIHWLMKTIKEVKVINGVGLLPFFWILLHMCLVKCILSVYDTFFIEINVCSSIPCQYGGQCTVNSTSGYTCNCSLGTEGTHCQTGKLIDSESKLWSCIYIIMYLILCDTINVVVALYSE